MLLLSPTSQTNGVSPSKCGHTGKGDGRANRKTGGCPSGLSSDAEILHWQPRRPQQTTHTLGGFKASSVFSHSPGGWGPSMAVSAGPAPSGSSRGGSFLISSSSWQLLEHIAILGLVLHHSDLCLHHLMAFLSGCSLLSLTGFRAHPDRVRSHLGPYLITSAKTLFLNMVTS